MRFTLFSSRTALIPAGIWMPHRALRSSIRSLCWDAPAIRANSSRGRLQAMKYRASPACCSEAIRKTSSSAPTRCLTQCLSQVLGGPTNLCLINTEKGSYKQVDAVLQNIADAHSDDALFDLDIKVYYEKQELLKDITSERYSKDVLYTFVLLMFTALSLFLVYAKCSYEARG